MSIHEDFGRHSEVKSSSDRSFGLIFSVVFAVVGLLPLMDGGRLRWWALAIAIILAVIAFAVPQVLAPVNRLWHRFGLLLNRIAAPLAIGLVFYLAVTPTGLIMRALGNDLLRLKRDTSVGSYWIKRDPPGPAPDGMSRQF